MPIMPIVFIGAFENKNVSAANITTVKGFTAAAQSLGPTVGIPLFGAGSVAPVRHP
jgi:hypothetical protein